MLEERHFYKKPPREGSITMPIVYKIDILESLKSKGYNTNKLRKEKLLSESVIQGLRENRYITLPNISTICSLLECQPGDLLEYVPDSE
jgi:putative transcriptional regulator